MSYINPDIQLQNLINQIKAIGNYVGYFYSLIPVNGATVSNNNTKVITTTNNQYAYSSNNYLTTWTAQADPSLNSNMFFGISTDINQVFPNASNVSMQMVNYGIVLDNLSVSNVFCFPIVDGIFYTNKTYECSSLTSTVKMSYSNGTINFYADDVEIVSFQQTGLNLENVKLIIGTVTGGSLNNIKWIGTGGSAGGSQNLAETLAFGNDANNLSIINLGALNVNNNIECESINANYQITASNNTVTPLINGLSNNLSLAPDNLHTKVMDLAVFQNNPMVYLYNQGNTKQGRIFDNTFYTPSNTYNFTFTSDSSSGTKLILPQTPTSILSFPINKGFTNYTMNLPQFDFTFDSNGSSVPTGNGIFKFWITDVKDDIPYALYGNSFTTPDISATQQFISSNNIILEYTNVNQSTILYLNVYIQYNNGGTYDMNDWAIAGQMIANISPINTITPVFTA